MRQPTWNQVLLLGTFLVAIQGCANYPISEPLRSQATRMPFRQVMQNPDAAKGFLVIWGGTILRTVNDPNGNRIYILELPLNSEERPKVHASSGGRFIARSNGFLDPQVYSPGRWVTLAGLITGTQTEALEKVQYTYPVLTIQEIHLWHQVTRWEMYPARPWGWGWGWGWGWYSPDRYWEWDEEH